MTKKIITVLILIFIILTASCSNSSPSAGQADTTLKNNTDSITKKVDAVKNAESGNQLRVVCLGDSVTAGVFELIRTGSHFFGGYVYDTESAFPARLENILCEKYGYDAVVYNAGISGDTVDQGMARLERDVFPRDPEIITICFGLNDVCLGDTALYKSQLGELFDAIRLWKPEVKIVFLTPNMLATYIHEDTKDDYVNYAMASGNVYITESGMLDDYMDAARQVCANYNIPVCDAYARWKKIYTEGADTTELLATHVTHPSREMHQVFADMLAETMLEYNIIG
ncbi:MAG: GDSL-type esterase/lipase family protein [Eubacteriales bacterium]